MTKQAIGMIDSGVGGLTVMKEAMKLIPNESFYYLGDTARCPYGPRPLEEVKEFTWQMAEFLMEKNIKMLVIACNTATAAALEFLQEKLPIPVAGVIQSGSQAAVGTTQAKRIGILGTEGTVKSNVYPRSIHKEDETIEVVSLACPPFVPLVENNIYDGEEAKKVVTDTLSPLQDKQLDTVVLGCTHYPILRPLIQEALGRNVQLVDAGAETVKTVKQLLGELNIAANPLGGKPEWKFFTTGAAQPFKELTEQWLEEQDLDVQHIELGEE